MNSFRFIFSKRTSICLVALLASLCVAAAPRSKAAIEAAAAKILNPASGHHARRQGALKVYHSNQAFTVMGYDAGGFAIVCNDDLLPAVIGYSDSKYDADLTNENFKWYLSTAEEAIKYYVSKSKPARIVTPDPSKYAPSVPSFVQTRWGQEEPFNNLCPDGTSSTAESGKGTPGRTVTGCIATAMAQIVNYNRYPQHGTGKHSVKVVQADGSNQTISVNFADSYYSYNDMLNSYMGDYTEAQGNAVAKLMLDCGVAANMEYATDGSGAYAKDACDGLRRYFGYPQTTRLLDRSSYEEPEWMDIVFNELNARRAILYTGVDYFNGGHAFVFDGYRSDGLIHVNWGWNGIDDGYYDVSLLNPDPYKFSSYQSMIVGFRGNMGPAISDTVTVTTPGTLAANIPDSLTSRLTVLKVNGQINSTDLRTIRRLAGRDSVGIATPGILSSLDLKDATIVAGGEPYLIADGKTYSTADNVLPYQAFYNCQGLSKLMLPETIDSIADGAIAGLVNVDSLYIPTQTDKKYILKDNAVYNPDTTELIALTVRSGGDYTIPASVTKIHDYALTGAALVKSLVIPASVAEIGQKAFANMSTLKQIRIYSKQPPVLGSNVFDGIDKTSCKLYVPRGTKSVYSQTEQWKDFVPTMRSKTYDNIVEFGTTVKARNASRKYGEQNPKFGWQMLGDYVEGKPEITCEATPSSPVGRYVLHVSQGTVTGEMVDFQDGYMIVGKNTARLKADTLEVAAGALTPVFTYTIDSLQNGETTTELTTEPTFSVVDASGSAVTAFNTVGAVYSIIPSGAESLNYDFVYVPGLLRVTDGQATGISTVTTADKTAATFETYNLAGQRVGKAYKGLVIAKGKKYLNK